MENFELVVHIGAGKTGSSSIQKTLEASSARLSEKGIAYLGLMLEHASEQKYEWQTPGGWPMLMSTGPQVAQQQLGEMLGRAVDDLRAKGVRRAIWSNETIFGNHNLVIPVLEQIQEKGVKVKVVLYVRRHDAWIRSAYLQWGIKHKTYQGPVKSFREWRKTNRISYSDGIRYWKDKPWIEFSVRNFDTCGDVTTDFLSWLGLDKDSVKISRDNEAPNPVALAMWALYNTQFGPPMLPAHLQKLLKRSGLLDRQPKDCDLDSLMPTPEDIAAVAAECIHDKQETNKVLAESGQPPMGETPLAHKDFSVTQNQINAALLLMIKHQADELALLRKQLRALLQGAENAA